MDHEAFGLWFSDQIKADTQQINNLLNVIDQLEQRQRFDWQYEGTEHVLLLDRDDATVRALNTTEEELPEEVDYSDEGSNAQCGLADFKAVVLAWQEFILG